MESCAGIYKIENKANGKVYIGQSVNVRVRLLRHMSSLRNQYHDSQILQRAFNKYGQDGFTWELLEKVEPSKLTEREQFWIDHYDAAGKGGYNICPSAESCAGVKHSPETIAKRKGRTPWNKGKSGYSRTPSPEGTNKKIGDAQRGEKNHNFGKPTPEEVKEKIRASNCGSKCYLAKLDEQKVREIKIALANGEVGKKLAEKYGVATTQISSIKNGKTWRHVTI